ncbi:hypothetical protein LguiA_007449 [Lonicera macranthoides]
MVENYIHPANPKLDSISQTRWQLCSASILSPETNSTSMVLFKPNSIAQAGSLRRHYGCYVFRRTSRCMPSPNF